MSLSVIFNSEANNVFNGDIELDNHKFRFFIKKSGLDKKLMINAEKMTKLEKTLKKDKLKENVKVSLQSESVAILKSSAFWKTVFKTPEQKEKFLHLLEIANLSDTKLKESVIKEIEKLKQSETPNS